MLTKSAAFWLDRCREQSGHGFVKLADDGGQDTSFEQSFSNAAHAYLREKAPTLLDHELGFQLVDRSQDNKKAVGVFVFKVGSQKLMAPIFWLKGAMKGHELLYMRNQDQFVPLKENWLNYILNRKPNILGSGVPRNTGQLGVRPPELNRIVNSPAKLASARFNPAVREFLPLMSKLAMQDLGEAVADLATHCRERLDLSHFMKQASLPALQVAVQMMQQRPAIARAFDEWHGMGVLQTAVKEAKARLEVNSILDNPYVAVNRNQPLTSGSILKQADDEGPQKLKIVTWDSTTNEALPEGLDEEDQEKLMKDNVLIKDERPDDQIATPVNIQVEQRLTNPTETGIYQVLVKVNGFEKCLIIVDPQGPAGRERMATVIRLDESDRNWGNFRAKDIWVAGQDESLLPGGEDSWQDFFDGLPDSTELESDGGYKARYILIGPRRNATCPFRVEEEIGSSMGTKSYNVDFSTSLTRYPRLGGPHFSVSETTDVYDRWQDGQRLHLDAKNGTDLRSSMGDVYVPVGYKVMKLQPTKGDEERAKAKDSDGPIACCGVSDDAASDPSPIQPGNLVDATTQIMQKTAGMKIACDGSRFNINGNDRLTHNDALITLVRDFRMREDISRHLLKEASRSQYTKKPFECRIKFASPFLTDSGPSAPNINDQMSFGGYNPMGFPGQTQSTYQEDLPIPDMSAQKTDPNMYNVNPSYLAEPMDVNGVNNAIQSGQQEVFDTTMIGSMLRAVRDDTMIDRYLPDLMVAVDRLGRILFMFYWHQDKFADRYGKQDMPELEDSLRNAFEMLGDVVLFLKQKTIEPYPEEDIRDIDLGPAADS